MNSGNEKKYLECGKIINTHGVKGAVKIESWCDSPEILADLPFIYFKTACGFEKKEILSASVMKRHVLATIEGINDYYGELGLTAAYGIQKGDIASCKVTAGTVTFNWQQQQPAWVRVYDSAGNIVPEDEYTWETLPGDRKRHV